MPTIKKIFLLVLCFSVLYSLPIHSAPLDGIGFIDVRFAVFQTKKAKAISRELSKQAEPIIKQLSELEKDLQFLQQKITREKDTLSPKKQKELLNEIQTKGKEYQNMRATLEQAKGAEEQKLLLSYREALEASVKNITTKNKLALLLNREAIVYTSPAHQNKDFTQQLIKALNAWDAKQSTNSAKKK